MSRISADKTFVKLRTELQLVSIPKSSCSTSMRRLVGDDVMGDNEVVIVRFTMIGKSVLSLVTL